MNESNEEFLIKNAYQKFMARELNRPEVRASKKLLLETYFRKDPVLIFQPGFMLPVLALAMMFMIFVRVEHSVQYEEGLQRREAEIAASISQSIGGSRNVDNALRIAPKGIALPPGEKFRVPRIEVKRATSDSGPVMVYQKLYKHTPVTIVWVFTGGNES